MRVMRKFDFDGLNYDLPELSCWNCERQYRGRIVSHCSVTCPWCDVTWMLHAGAFERWLELNDLVADWDSDSGFRRK